MQFTKSLAGLFSATIITQAQCTGFVNPCSVSKREDTGAMPKLFYSVAQVEDLVAARAVKKTVCAIRVLNKCFVADMLFLRRIRF